MGTLRAGVLAILAMAVSACASSPATTSTPERRATSAPPPEVSIKTEGMAENEEGDESGLGTLASNGRDLIDCGRKRRLGTRIPRRVCDPNSFNGMYPSAGINMGTARESQPGYGSH